MPFSYQSTGVETHFTNGLDPEPRARPTFAFHRPDSLRQWIDLLQAPGVLVTGIKQCARSLTQGYTQLDPALPARRFVTAWRLSLREGWKAR